MKIVKLKINNIIIKFLIIFSKIINYFLQNFNHLFLKYKMNNKMNKNHKENYYQLKNLN